MLPALGLALLLGGAPSPAHLERMPSDLVEYYRDYNFVNAFSSPAERRVLVKGSSPPDDRRLRSVAHALARLAGQTENVDAGIMLGQRLEDRAKGRLPRHESEFGSDVVRVTAWRADEAKGEAWVELEVLTLDEGVSGLLLVNFDRLTQGGKSMPKIDDLLPYMRPRLMRMLETHYWQRIGSDWRRTQGVLVLTAQ